MREARRRQSGTRSFGTLDVQCVRCGGRQEERRDPYWHWFTPFDKSQDIVPIGHYGVAHPPAAVRRTIQPVRLANVLTRQRLRHLAAAAARAISRRRAALSRSARIFPPLDAPKPLST